MIEDLLIKLGINISICYVLASVAAFLTTEKYAGFWFRMKLKEKPYYCAVCVALRLGIVAFFVELVLGFWLDYTWLQIWFSLSYPFLISEWAKGIWNKLNDR